MTDITATPAAIRQFQKMLNKLKATKGIRLTVKNSGCSGKKYVLDPIKQDDDIVKSDEVYQLAENLTLYVDSESLQYVEGTQIDYEIKNLKGQVVFNNPKEKSHCGCGESFYV
jgi:iron-sulfur cluster assembly accessory protein